MFPYVKRTPVFLGNTDLTAVIFAAGGETRINITLMRIKRFNPIFVNRLLTVIERKYKLEG